MCCVPVERAVPFHPLFAVNQDICYGAVADM